MDRGILGRKCEAESASDFYVPSKHILDAKPSYVYVIMQH